jgi:hypothetical protein
MDIPTERYVRYRNHTPLPRASFPMRTETPPASRDFHRPSNALWWTEQWRSLADAASLASSLPRLHRGERGDGHGVLVMPGLLADDLSTTALRGILTARGYRATPWGLGANIGPTPRIVDGITTRLHDLADRTGSPVSLVGWSLGGFLARELARRFPDEVRMVITLGTALQLTPEDDPDLATVGRIFHALRPLHTDFLDAGAQPANLPLPVPATAIYSRQDGVVPWAACLEPDGPLSESVEVIASHCGLGWNAEAIQVVLDRLRLTADTWQPYRRAAAAAA